ALQPAILPNLNDKLEEETLQWYTKDHFYPVQIGEIFHPGYKATEGITPYGSVGIQADSYREDAYVTLKMCERNSGPGEREKGIYDHLRSIKSSHIGSTLVRRALDDFQLRSADNEHSYQCLVHPPLGMSLHELMNRAKGKHLPAELVKPAVLHVLFALDFLHTETGVVHTGMVFDCS
ncbi:protein kinase, partial [Penicillium longicatenatum]|uniref:protein kinase n=1 Tax=Penicillium longicatenatum TaxID=1561947 RepID=UPI002547D5AC